MPFRFSLTLILILGTLPVPGSDFEEANALAAERKFQEAIKAYEEIKGEERLSADLFFNLGVAQYRGGQEEMAALSFERALVLDPRHTEAAQNIAFLDKTTGRLTFETTIAQRLSRFASFTQLVSILSIGAWVLLLGIILAKVHRTSSTVRGVTVILIVLGSLASVTGAAGLALKSEARQDLESRAIVTEKDQVLRVEASTSSQKIVDLPPGSEVIIIADRNPWSYIEVADKLRGWIKSDGVTPLWPYDPALAD